MLLIGQKEIQVHIEQYLQLQHVSEQRRTPKQEQSDKLTKRSSLSRFRQEMKPLTWRGSSCPRRSSHQASMTAESRRIIPTVWEESSTCSQGSLLSWGAKTYRWTMLLPRSQLRKVIYSFTSSQYVYLFSNAGRCGTPIAIANVLRSWWWAHNCWLSCRRACCWSLGYGCRFKSRRSRWSYRRKWTRRTRFTMFLNLPCASSLKYFRCCLCASQLRRMENIVGWRRISILSGSFDQSLWKSFSLNLTQWVDQRSVGVVAGAFQKQELWIYAKFICVIHSLKRTTWYWTFAQYWILIGILPFILYMGWKLMMSRLFVLSMWRKFRELLTRQ